MASYSPKRRKLNHDVSESDSSDGNGSSQTASSKITPTKKLQTAPRSPESSAYSGNAYKSSIFKLQTDEMLAEVQRDPSEQLGIVYNALWKLKAGIEGIEQIGPLSVQEASKLLYKSHKIVIPFPDPKSDKNVAYKLSYEPPSDINIVGSYTLKTMTKDDHTLAVDMIVTMPSSILQEKDYLNYRYFHKRAYYLACIADGLLSSVGNEFDLKFGYLSGNDLQPILVAMPKNVEHEFSKSKCQINIIPAAPEDFFAASKLHPTKNSIRPRTVSGSGNATPAPTPFYNAAVSMDSNYGRYLRLLNHTSKNVDSFRDACILGRIWLRQRGFGGEISRGGFGNFEWAALMALLLQGGGVKGHSLLSPGYSSYQLFKGLIQFLSSNDLASHPLNFQASGDLLTASGNPMFFDGPRSQNLLFRMTPSSYAALHDATKTSLEMLNNPTFDQFDATFILKKDHPLQEFDFRVQIPESKTTENSGSQDHSSQILQFGIKVYEVLKKGLTNRVKLIHVKTPEPPLWSLKTTPDFGMSGVSIGIVVDPANVDRVVDHGPAADAKNDAAQFHKFWGKKAELRRFQDGSILESVVWPSNTTDLMLTDIISYLLKRHFNIEIGESIDFKGDCFLDLLPAGIASTKAFVSIVETFRLFEQEIRNMDSLPLQLKQLSPTGPQLRFSSILPPILGARKHQRSPADVIVQFEGSGRWPDNVVAIQRTKIAFLLKLGILLESSVHGLISKLGIENSERNLANCAFLDVLYPTGPAFRLRIHNEREATLLSRQIEYKSTSSHTREDAVYAKSLYTRMYVHAPLHTQSVAILCARFSLLSPTIRLVKKWFETHMLANHFNEEVLELFVIRTFLQPYPWSAPSSSGTGFLRTLQFISRWDWRITPLVVDFSGSMTSRDIDAVQIRLDAWRKIDPAMNRTVLLAASNHDITGKAFTEGSPSKVVAARMTTLARSACAMMKTYGSGLDRMALFTSSMGDYDFVIHLSSDYAGSRRGPLDAKLTPFKNLEIQSNSEPSRLGYEPVHLFIEELREIYANNILFFYDTTTNSNIAALWNPQTLSRPFKVNTSHAIKPTGNKSIESEAVEIDKLAILSEIARLGGDMIADIEQHR